MAAERWTWYPPGGGDPIDLTRENGFRVVRVEGADDNRVRAQSHKAPFQLGETLIDVEIEPRVIEIELVITASTREQLLARRRQLSRAMAMSTKPHIHHFDAIVAPGTLRYTPPTGEVLEIQAVPQDSPQFAGRARDGGLIERATIELFCPDPLWRETTTRFLELQRSGGFSFPLSFPLVMPSNDAQAQIDNLSDVPIPILARLYGPAQDPVLTNVTTGEELGLAVDVPEGAYVEIETAFGRKRVEMIDSTGLRLNLMYALDLERSSFWALQPGLNIVQFRKAVEGPGKAALFWQHAFMGV